MRIGQKEFDVANETYVMGILNVTPDSFSDGGMFDSVEEAVSHAAQMIEEGAHIIDVGGESTRPGYKVLSEEEEIERVVPVIKEIKSRFNIPISIDTYKSKVAKAAIEAGADLINDIWGLKGDCGMAEVIAASGLPCCLMHNRNEANYQNFMRDVEADVREIVRIARQAGIAEQQIILDPGIGFGKTRDHNLEMLKRLEELHMFGYPLLLAASRKSVIGLTLELPVEERMEGTLVTTVFGVLKGCSFIRVHDVKENIRAIRMAKAILRSTSQSEQ